MKCAQHVELDAVGTCNSCGRGLCSDCAAVFTPPLCGACASAHNKGIAKTLWVQLFLMLGLFITALILLLGKTPWLDAVGFACVAAFFPSGWRFLGRYFAPSGGYFSPLARWMSLAVQAFAAACIGVVVGPIFLFRAWREFRVVRGTKDLLDKS
ncbi:hypothetical protein OPU71_18090 [Niveibacterium sp. 24ML]|uniref:hypothetical protein n=1 Tax=Niveibacterium sp. 24ML TaxID=2985512 RepID=UPI00226F0350|nr:hypothetical protein [Niveibacterium sp. 24ML]MCX9158036.1 hypothetical protein [Niveibacterium sp. 24ML]